MKTEDQLHRIIALIGYMQRDLENSVACGLHDKYKLLENIICPILSRVYGYSGLRNLNQEKENFPAIDLADDGNSVGIQVTGDASLNKIRETLHKYIKWRIYDRYSQLKIFVLNKKPIVAKDDDLQEIIQGRFKFNRKSDVIDCADILKRLSRLKSSDLDAIRDILEYEYGQAERRRPEREVLAELLSRSIARCRVLWRGAGLSKEMASQFAEDRAIGDRLEIEFQQHVSEVIVVNGDFGSGKSLACERLLQKTVQQRIETIDAAIPIYIDAKQLTVSLSERIELDASHFRLRQGSRIVIVIDRADELTITAISDLVNEAHVLCETRLGFHIVIALRPLLPVFTYDRAIALGPLEMTEAAKIVSIVSGRSVDDYHLNRAQPTVRVAVRKPLFAVMLGQWMAENSSWIPERELSTFSEIVDKALELRLSRIGESEKYLDKLQQLSIAVIDSADGCLLQSGVGDSSEIAKLVSTGLIYKEGETIQFSLPIITQWFAARSIFGGHIDEDELLSNVERVARWKEVLIVYLSMYSGSRITLLIPKLVSKYPFVAHEVVWRCKPRHQPENAPSPSFYEIGERLSYAMLTWANAVKPLSSLINNVKADGLPRTVAIFGGPAADTIAISWCEVDRSEAVIVNPAWDEEQEGHLLWRAFSANHRVKRLNSIWEWRLVLNMMIEKLDDLIKDHGIPDCSELSLEELLYGTAIAYMSYSYRYPSRILVSDIVERIRRNRYSDRHGPPRNISVRIPGYDRRRWFNYHWFETRIHEINDHGLDFVADPLGEPDLSEERWGWGSYSDDRLILRTKQLFERAIEVYHRLVNEYFTQLKNYMPYYRLFPSRVNVRITRGRAEEKLLGLQWFFEVLPENQQSQVIVSARNYGYEERTYSMIEKKMSEDVKIIEAEISNIKRLRPGLLDWMHTFGKFSLNIDVAHYDHVSQLVYLWLKTDLEQIGWTKESIKRLNDRDGLGVSHYVTSF